MKVSPKAFRRIGFAVLLLAAMWLPAVAIYDAAKILAGYPYSEKQPSDISPHGFPYRSSMDYAAWTITNLGITYQGRSFINNWDGGTYQDSWGDPKNWPRFATKLGFTVDRNPAVGAIAQWATKYPGALADQGHLAVVTGVHSNGTIDVDEFDFRSESNNFSDHAFGHRSAIGPADTYIHLERELPGGIWNIRTTPSGTIGDTITIVVELKDNNNGGLELAKIAANLKRIDGTWSGYRPIRQQRLNGQAKAAIELVYAVPPDAMCVRLSFDVFSRNRSIDGTQSRQLAPMGIRRYGRPNYDCQT